MDLKLRVFLLTASLCLLLYGIYLLTKGGTWNTVFGVTNVVLNIYNLYMGLIAIK